ncbi:MAG: hypothetical protein L3J69_06125 [Desulfobacula sp.]|nr:hypothetical protein [Desulfobacula sp.]
MGFLEHEILGMTEGQIGIYIEKIYGKKSGKKGKKHKVRRKRKDNG